MKRESRPVWVDAGCGDGGLVMTAADYGFASVGLDTRAEAGDPIRELGFSAVKQDFMKLNFEVVVDVLSMMDVLEHIPYPVEALRKAAQVLRPGGLIVISMADLDSSSWKMMEAGRLNPYWVELERYHNFGRQRLVTLLQDCGFDVVDFAIPNRYKAQMEITRCGNKDQKAGVKDGPPALPLPSFTGRQFPAPDHRGHRTRL